MRCTVGFLFSRLEAVLEQDAAVEDQMVCAAVAGVHTEIAYAHELEARRGLRCAAFTLGVVLLCLFDERGFDLAAGQDRQGVRVQAVEEVLVRAVGLGVGEEVLIQAHLGVDRCFAVDPVDRRALDLAAGSPPRESGSYVA